MTTCYDVITEGPNPEFHSFDTRIEALRAIKELIHAGLTIATVTETRELKVINWVNEIELIAI